MKTLILILVVLALLAVIIWFWAKSAVMDINFKLKLALPKIADLQQAINLNQPTPSVKVGLQITITNRNIFSIPLKDLRVSIYSDGALVARSSDVASNNVKIKVPAHGKAIFIHTVDLLLLPSFFQALAKLKAGEKLTLKFNITGSVFNLPVTYTDTFDYEQNN